MQYSNGGRSVCLRHVASIAYLLRPGQFRVAEILKSLVLFYPDGLLAFALGVFLANLTSPYVGPLELVFMPAANVLGAFLAMRLAKYSVLAGALVYAAVVSLAVSITLGMALGLAPGSLFLPIAASEGLLLVAGIPLGKRIGNVLNEWTASARHE